MRLTKEKIEAAVSEGITPEYFDEYVKLLLENARDADKKLHRSILLLIFFMTVFELLTRSSITEASVGPFKVNDLSSLH